MNARCPNCGAPFQTPQHRLIAPEDSNLAGRFLWLANCSGCNTSLIGEGDPDLSVEAEDAVAEAAMS